MTTYEITYIRTGKINETDKVWINTTDEFEFEDGIFTVHNIIDAIEAFEKIAAKWWGTYETKNAITNINIIAC